MLSVVDDGTGTSTAFFGFFRTSTVWTGAAAALDDGAPKPTVVVAPPPPAAAAAPKPNLIGIAAGAAGAAVAHRRRRRPKPIVVTPADDDDAPPPEEEAAAAAPEEASGEVAVLGVDLAHLLEELFDIRELLGVVFRGGGGGAVGGRRLEEVDPLLQHGGRRLVVRLRLAAERVEVGGRRRRAARAAGRRRRLVGVRFGLFELCDRGDAELEMEHGERAVVRRERRLLERERGAEVGDRRLPPLVLHLHLGEPLEDVGEPQLLPRRRRLVREARDLEALEGDLQVVAVLLLAVALLAAAAATLAAIALAGRTSPAPLCPSATVSPAAAASASALAAAASAARVAQSVALGPYSKSSSRKILAVDEMTRRRTQSTKMFCESTSSWRTKPSESGTDS